MGRIYSLYMMMMSHFCTNSLLSIPHLFCQIFCGFPKLPVYVHSVDRCSVIVSFHVFLFGVIEIRSVFCLFFCVFGDIVFWRLCSYMEWIAHHRRALLYRICWLYIPKSMSLHFSTSKRK